MSFIEITPTRVVLGDGKLDTNFNYIFPVPTVNQGEPFISIPKINEESILVIINQADRDFYNSVGLNIVYSVAGYKKFSRQNVNYVTGSDDYVLEAR
jgi:hypothetical protein